MIRTACSYSIARFLPYRDSGEFVNIGVLLACPPRGLLLKRFEERQGGRIRGFFPALDMGVYHAVRAAAETELERVGGNLAAAPGQTGVEELSASCLHAFRQIVRPRESILRFGETGVVMSDDPRATLEILFRRYVEPAGPDGSDASEDSV